MGKLKEGRFQLFELSQSFNLPDREVLDQNPKTADLDAVVDFYCFLLTLGIDADIRRMTKRECERKKEEGQSVSGLENLLWVYKGSAELRKVLADAGFCTDSTEWL
jgi:hypothetical protein